MIHIIIPVHNRLDLTKNCLKSIYEQSFKDWSVYIVDDGSTDGTKEYISSLENSKINYLEADGSLWWTGAIKLGISKALEIADSNDFIMTVNNDIIFEANTINRLLDNMENNYTICSSLSVSDRSEIAMSSGSKVISWIFNITRHPFYGKSYEKISKAKNVEVDMLTGRSVIYPTKIFIEGCNFDNLNFPHYGGDSEFTNRAQRSGYKLLIVPSSIIYVNRESTGLNPLDKKLTLVEIIRSFYSIRSTNNIATKIKFSLKVPPWYARPTYMFISIIKVFILALVGNFFIKKTIR